MEAPEEVRARATLNEMQLRISQGPNVALGVPEGASLEQVRSAFLALTKQFHPARFGRMGTEIQRLSNEVFLGIKAAHDALAKALGGGKRAAAQSGGMPVIQPEPASRVSTGSIPLQARQSGAMPPVGPARPGTPPTFARGTDRPTSNDRPGVPPDRSSSPVIARTTTPIQAGRAATPIQPARTTAPNPPARTGTPPPAGRATTNPAAPVQPARTTTPPLGTPVQRPSTPPVTHSASRPVTPTGSRPTTPPARPPGASSALNPDTVRGVAPPREPAFDERAALREALMLVNEQSWAAARNTLSTLASKVPQSKNYRALLGYVRGREAAAAGKTDEAALEYQRALELDPGLSMAKQALADVQRRR